MSVRCRSFFVYYESLKRELKTKPIYEFRYDERLQTKVEEFTRLEVVGVTSMFRLIRRDSEMVRMCPTLHVICEENAVRRKWKLVCAR